MGFLKDVLGGFAMGHHGGGRYGGGHHGRREYRDDGPFPDYSRRPVDAPPAATCDKCGGANVTRARFCQQCGAPLSADTCQGCRAELTPGAKFCSQCGRTQ